MEHLLPNNCDDRESQIRLKNYKNLLNEEDSNKNHEILKKQLLRLSEIGNSINKRKNDFDKPRTPITKALWTITKGSSIVKMTEVGEAAFAIGENKQQSP